MHIILNYKNLSDRTAFLKICNINVSKNVYNFIYSALFSVNKKIF